MEALLLDVSNVWMIGFLLAERKPQKLFVSKRKAISISFHRPFGIGTSKVNGQMVSGIGLLAAAAAAVVAID